MADGREKTRVVRRGELVPNDWAAEKIGNNVRDVREDTYVTKDITVGLGEGSSRRDLGRGGDAARASVVTRPMAME